MDVPHYEQTDQDGFLRRMAYVMVDDEGGIEI
jgi:hypothetical protein